MKASIITVSFNSVNTIEDCIMSVANQSYKNIEYIIVDGGSTDGTVDIIKKHANKISFWVSEKDNGIYHAMNKGIHFATGNIIGIINSDDFYADSFVVDNIIEFITKENVDTCYGDLVYVDREDKNRTTRIWKPGKYSKTKFKKGWMPPHPTFFVKNHIYDKYGSFNLKFPVVADYELMLRLLYKYNISTAYIPKVLVKMRTGGKSRPSFFNIMSNNISCYCAWRANGLRPNIITFLFKPFSKLNQFIKRR
ncbi:MAG: glycosyltransferase family 2 protein [Candidatus Hodarchaeota archaeon]